MWATKNVRSLHREGTALLRSTRTRDRCARSETKQVGVLAPCIAEAAFRHDCTEGGICEDVHPRSGRGLVRRKCDDIFAAGRRESADPVEEDQIICWRSGGFARLRPMDARRSKLRNSHLRRSTIDLLGKGSLAIGDDCARDRLEKDTVSGRYLFCV